MNCYSLSLLGGVEKRSLHVSTAAANEMVCWCFRWAIKQEKFDNIGQWKHTQVENPDWNKQALSWPITPDGQLNDDYDWPMEGYLLAYAPPTKSNGGPGGSEADKSGSSASDHGSTSLRLQVLKNGAQEGQTKAVPVIAPVRTNQQVMI